MKTIFDLPCSTRYISHRGFTPLAPENSLPAFEYAGVLSQWAIETDVRITRDGVIVCCHDADTSRMFGEAGRVEEMTFQALSRLRMCSGERRNCFRDEQLRMPLFSEYLAVCRAFGCVPFIELKTPQVDCVLRAVREAGFEEGGVVMSALAMDWLFETRRNTKDMFIHWIFAEEKGLETFASVGNAGVSLNMPDAFLCPKEKISLAHEMGLKICLRAGDTEESVQQMMRLGLDYIPTNCMHLPIGPAGRRKTNEISHSIL